MLGYQKNNVGGWEVLIRQKELPDQHEASWESYDEIHQQYPKFHLEDKAMSPPFVGIALSNFYMIRACN
ncbi:Translation initiation factor eIF-2B subunit gamma [Cucumis melo var. makuwa]|uniref:Translation initiation factor eIF-2B subunit gamma n=1 Tax=Cucumis melo var. makuwa TaxID=1194695 RepID=A0A5A7TUR5_CUCMM|nr:Translation initiation factor eIF-2B subunit gamma [Cucumis melo var. makuwa]